MNLDQLVEAYENGALDGSPMWIDNDTVYVYDEVADKQVFEMHPAILLLELLDYLGIPHEGV